eukprot:scaffold182362_cov26-Tisochrysis_lutea.AAC.7
MPAGVATSADAPTSSWTKRSQVSHPLANRARNQVERQWHNCRGLQCPQSEAEQEALRCPFASDASQSGRRRAAVRTRSVAQTRQAIYVGQRRTHSGRMARDRPNRETLRPRTRTPRIPERFETQQTPQERPNSHLRHAPSQPW